MPKISERGDIGHGIGGGVVGRNNVQVARGGFLGWQDADTMAFANGDDAYIVSSYHVPTQRIERIHFDDVAGARKATPIILRQIPRPASRSRVRSPLQITTGANAGYAWGGHVHCFLASKDDARGVFSTTGFRSRDAGLLQGGYDGSMIYKPVYQSGGPTQVRLPNGDEWNLTAGHADYSHIVARGRGAHMEQMNVFVHDLPAITSVNDGGIWKVEIAYAAGQWWQAYYSAMHGVVLHPFGSLDGFAILPKGDGWHTIREIAANVIRVAVASGEGEQPGQIWVRDYDVAANMIRDPWGANTWAPVARVDIRTINKGKDPDVPETMRMPDDVYRIFADVARKYKTLHASANDDDRREATRRGVETIRARAETQADRWVHKAAGPGNPPSKDAIAFIPGGEIRDRLQTPMFMFDMINGSSRDVNPQPTGELGTQWIVLTGTHDWLSDVPIDPPVGTTHKYDGGGNDTNECDVCHKSRFDPIHAIPQSKIKHTYDGGEQDTGLCDICQKPKDDALHSTGPVDPDPVDTKHEFVGTGKFCSECGKAKTDPIHDMTPVPTTGGGVDAETKGILRDILASNHAQEKALADLGTKIDTLRTGVISSLSGFAAELLAALKLGKLFGGGKDPNA